MEIEEMLNKRDISTTVNLVIMNKLGTDFIKPSMMEDFEQLSINDYIDFVKEKLEEHKIHALISIAWAKTKFLYEKQKKLYDFIQKRDDLFIIWMPELLGFIITDDRLNYYKIIKNSPYREMSDIFIQDIIESDNGIEITYIYKSVVVEFEEKPLSVQEDEKESQLLNYS